MSTALLSIDERARRAARFWDRMAHRYARGAIADRAGYERTLERTAHWLAPQHDLLEIGCGTGATALRLAPAVRTLRATDVSGEMIAIARQRLQAQPVPGLSFERAGADQALAGGARYDGVLAFSLLHLLPDLDATLGAVAGALRPGGLFISKTPCIAEMNLLVRRVAVPLVGAFGLMPPLGAFDGAQLQAALRRHGFVLLAHERHGTRGADMRAFVVARMRGGQG